MKSCLCSTKKNDTEFGVMMMTVEISTNKEIFNLFTLIITKEIQNKDSTRFTKNRNNTK